MGAAQGPGYARAGRASAWESSSTITFHALGPPHPHHPIHITAWPSEHNKGQKRTQMLPGLEWGSCLAEHRHSWGTGTPRATSSTPGLSENPQAPSTMPHTHWGPGVGGEARQRAHRWGRGGKAVERGLYAWTHLLTLAPEHLSCHSPSHERSSSVAAPGPRLNWSVGHSSWKA